MKRTVAILSALTITGIAGAASASHPSQFNNVSQARFQAQMIVNKASALIAGAKASRRRVRKAAAINALKKVKRSANNFLRQATWSRPALRSAFANIKARYNQAKWAFATMRPNRFQRAQFASIAQNLKQMAFALSRVAPRPVRHVSYGHDVRPVVKAPPARVTYKPYTVTYRPIATTAVYTTPGTTVSWYRTY